MRTISLIEFLTKVRALPIHLYQDFFFHLLCLKCTWLTCEKYLFSAAMVSIFDTAQSILMNRSFLELPWLSLFYVFLCLENQIEQIL